MTCSEEKLNAYIDGELEYAERESLEAHVATCGDCRRALDALRAQDADLGAAFAVPRERTREAAERVPFREPSRRGFGWVAIPIAAAAGFLIAWLVRRPAEDPRIERLERELAELRARRPEPKPMARLEVATGAVEVSSGGDWRPLATGGGVPAGTRVRTIGPAKCSLVCDDGSEVRLNANTEVGFQAPRSFDLSRGQIYTVVAPAPSKFEVRTAQAAIEALGTSLDISHVARTSETHEKKEAGENVTTLVVLEGKARFGGRTVDRGQRCRIVDGRNEEPQPLHDLALHTKWVHEILRLKGGDDGELERRVNEMLARIGEAKMAHFYEPEIRAMGERCALPLLRYVQSPQSRANPQRRHSAARILADIAGPSLVPDLVELLEDSDPEVRVHVAGGLKRITGQSFGLQASDWTSGTGGCDRWRGWLQDHRDTWGAPKRERK